LRCQVEKGEASSRESTRTDVFQMSAQAPSAIVVSGVATTPAKPTDDLAPKDELSRPLSDEDRANTEDLATNLIKLIRDPELSVEESAFAKLCGLSSLAGTPQLLFDLARQICLWGGLDARVSKILLREEPLKVGRAPGLVDLPLPAPSVSRQHTAFFTSPNGVEVEDLSSHGGTFINGKRCRRERVFDGDSVRIGACEITVHVLPSDRTIAM
jgi:hypothetical protein